MCVCMCVQEMCVYVCKKCVCVCARALTQSYLCDPIDCNPPGSSVHGIFQAGILEWVSCSYPGGSSRLRDQTPILCISCIGRRILYPCATAKPSSRPQDLSQASCIAGFFTVWATRKSKQKNTICLYSNKLNLNSNLNGVWIIQTADNILKKTIFSPRENL